MSWTPAEVADRLEIAEVVTRYSYGLDQRRWDEWDRAFTQDAVIDFSFWGLAPAAPAELRRQFTANDATRISGQHLLANQMIWLDGDTARSWAEFSLVTLSRTERAGFARRVRGGGAYEDRLIRTDAGWRIVHRRGIGKWNEMDEIPWQPSA